MDIRPFAGISPGASGAAPAAAAPRPAAPVKSTSVEPQTTRAVETTSQTVHAEQTKQAVQQINAAIASLSQGVEFAIDEDSQRTVVKIVDSQTKEVLRQMPSKEALEIARALDRFQGLLIKQQA